MLIFLIISISTAFAQGHLVSKPFAFGYSGSLITANEKGYYVNTVGVTLLRIIDVYRGMTRIEEKYVTITGTTLYIRKNFNQPIYPVISFAATNFDGDLYPVFGVGFVCKIFTKDNSMLQLIPNCAINFDGYEWHFSGGADISIGGYLSENVGLYTEPGISIGEELTWNLEIGLVFQYGRDL